MSHVTCHASHVTRHTSHVTRHTSHVTLHTSHVTHHTSHVTRHTSHVTLHTSHVTRHSATGTHRKEHRTSGKPKLHLFSVPFITSSIQIPPLHIQQAVRRKIFQVTLGMLSDPRPARLQPCPSLSCAPAFPVTYHAFLRCGHVQPSTSLTLCISGPPECQRTP